MCSMEQWMVRMAVLAIMILGWGSFGNPAAEVLAQDHGKQSQSDPRTDKEKATVPKAKTGLLVNDPRACQGYTLLAPIMSTKTYLLDMQGRVVRTWNGDSGSALTTVLLENGNLLRLAKLAEQPFGDGPGAAGHVQEFTWDGELVWDFKLANARQLSHHDICKMPNGNVLFIVWEKKTAAEAIAAGRRPETVGKDGLIPDAVIEVQPTGKTTGKVVWEWHAWDHLIQDHDPTKANYGDVAAHPELIDINFGEGTLAAIVAKPEELDRLRAIGYVGAAAPGRPAPVKADWLHCNAIAYNPELDQIMLCCPEFNEIWVIDHSTTTAEAASHRGGRSGKGGDLLYRWGNPRAYRAGTVKDQKLFFQHHAHWIPKGLPGAGNILIFNNGQKRIGGAYSSVDEIVPPLGPDGRYERQPGAAFGPDQPVWSYSAPKRTEFYSSFISGAHRLPNGNTFICAGPSGTLFEVTPDKQIVWRYVNPAKPDPLAGMRGQLRPVTILAPFLRQALAVTEEQTRQLDELLREAQEKLETVLTEEQRQALAVPPKSSGPVGPPPSASAPQAVQILPPLLRQRVKLTDDQRKTLETLRQEAEARLDQLLTAEQRRQLQDIRAGFLNAWTGGAPVGGPPNRSGATGKADKGKSDRPPPPPAGGPPRLEVAVYRSYRYAMDYPGLSGRDLTPGKTVQELESEDAAGK